MKNFLVRASPLLARRGGRDIKQYREAPLKERTGWWIKPLGYPLVYHPVCARFGCFRIFFFNARSHPSWPGGAMATLAMALVLHTYQWGQP